MFISLRIKLLIAFTLLFSVVFAGAYYWFYDYATRMATSRLVEDLDTLLVNTANYIDGDNFEAIAADAKPREDGYSDDPRFWTHIQELVRTAQVDTRSGVYTFVAGGPDEILFIGSSGALDNPPSGVTFKESCVTGPDCGDVGPNLAAINDGTLIHQLDAYEDQWGKWISAYTPIKNSSGKIVGALGIDFRAEYVDQVQQGIKDNLVLAFALTYLILFITVFIIARAFTNPVRTLTKVTAQIAEGDYNQDHVLAKLTKNTLRDEITSLASAFHTMADKVEKREQNLKQQVVELQIQIDMSKRDKDVNQIVESEYFRELQTKVDQLKARTREPKQPAPTTQGVEPKTPGA